MWIESENGTLYNTHWLQSLDLKQNGDRWVLIARFALTTPTGTTTASATGTFVTTTLKSFETEHQARGVFDALKQNLGAFELRLPAR